MKKILILTLAVSMTYAQGTWTSLGFNLATVSGYGAISFVIGGNAYYGTGARGGNFDNCRDDMWRYNGATWSQIAPVPTNGVGQGRVGAWAYALEGTGYVGGGAIITGTGISQYRVDNNIHTYNPATGFWNSTSMRGNTSYARVGASTGVLGQTAYIFGGTTRYPTDLSSSGSYIPTYMTHVFGTFSGIPVNSRTGPLALPSNFYSVAFASALSIEYAGNGIDNPLNMIGISGGRFVNTTGASFSGDRMWTFNGSTFTQTGINTSAHGAGSFSFALNPDGVAYYGGGSSALVSAFDPIPFSTSTGTYSIANITTASSFSSSFVLGGCRGFIVGGGTGGSSNTVINQFLRYRPASEIFLYPRSTAGINGLTFCGGAVGRLNFKTNCFFQDVSNFPVNFDVQLSDNTGSFNNLTVLGTRNAMAGPNTFEMIIPIPTIGGTNYRMRIVTSVAGIAYYSNTQPVNIISRTSDFIPKIVGPITICNNSMITYSISNLPTTANPNFYRWATSDPWNNLITISPIIGFSTVATTHASYQGDVSITGFFLDTTTGCLFSSGQSTLLLRVRAGTPPPTTIIGPPTICNGSTVKYQSLTNITFQNTLIPASWFAPANPTNNAILANTNYDFVSYVNPFTTLKPIANVRGTNPGVQRLELYMPSTASGCVGTPTTMDITVTGAETPIVTTPSNVVCVTNSLGFYMTTVLGNTYSWNLAGQGSFIPYKTNTFMVGVFTTAGIFTVTGLAINGGCTTPSAPILVRAIGIPTITGNLNPCDLTRTTYSVVSVAGVTFTWSLAGPGTINSIGNLATVTGATGVSGGVLTITAIANTGTCTQTSRALVTVNGCCRPYYSNTAGIPSVLGVGSTMPTINAGGGTITLSGSFNVVGFLTLTNGTFVIPENTIFYVEPVVRISVNNGTVISLLGGNFQNSCITRWHGIDVTETSSFYSTTLPGGIGKKPVLAGSLYGLFFTKLANSYIQNTLFLANNRSIQYSTLFTSGAPETQTGLGYIRNNIFDCNTVTAWGGTNSCDVTTGFGQIYLEDIDLNPITITGNVFKKSAIMIRLVKASAAFIYKNTFFVESEGISTYNITPAFAGTTYIRNNDITILTERAGVKFGVSCFASIDVSYNYIHDEDGNPYNYLTSPPSGIETSCGPSTSFSCKIYNNTITGMDKAIQNGSCASTINIYNNYFVNNNHCIFGGDGFYGPNNFVVSCNTMKNATYGYYSATTGTVPGFIDQGTASAPAANKFINVTNPIFQASSITGAWTYNRASDDNAGPTAIGAGAGQVTFNITGLTVLSRCGTATPGLRKGLESSIVRFSVYPNPFTDELILDFEAAEVADYQLSIVYTLGVIVYNQTGKATEGETQLKLALNLPHGMYLLSLQSGGKTYRVKVIKN